MSSSQLCIATSLDMACCAIHIDTHCLDMDIWSIASGPHRTHSRVSVNGLRGGPSLPTPQAASLKRL
jgi:hypothetical protein